MRNFQHPLRGSPAFWTLLVALAAVALYLPAIGFPFVYDSNPQILIDDFVHQPRHFLDVLTLRVMGMDVLDFNRPVNLFTLLTDSLLWGKNPAGYHLTNVLLHGATAALLFCWLRELVGQLWPALIAALLFAVHPLHCEAVVEVGYREDLLATFFLLAGLRMANGGWQRAKGDAIRVRWLPAIGIVACLGLSVASKETGVVAPVALGLYWILFRQTGRQAPQALSLATTPADRSRPWLILIATTAAVAAGFMTARFALEPKHSVIFDTPPARMAAAWGDLLLIQCRIFSAEFLRIVWPANLCADYNGYSIRNISAVVAAVALAVLLASQGFLCAMGKHKRLFLLGTAIFWLSLLPVANLIPIYRPMADRFLYMPLTGLALMLATALAALRGPMAGTIRGAAIAAVVALSWVTWREEQNWRDDLALWGTTAERNPFSFNAWLGVGYAQLDRNQPAKAIEAFNRASVLAHGNRAEPWAGLALGAEAMGRHPEAGQCLKQAAALDRRYDNPDRLLQALILEPARVERLKVIALRASKAAKPQP